MRLYANIVSLQGPGQAVIDVQTPLKLVLQPRRRQPNPLNAGKTQMHIVA